MEAAASCCPSSGARRAAYLNPVSRAIIGTPLEEFMVRAICTSIMMLAALSAAQQATPSQASAPGSAADLIQQGEKLSREGKQDEALALYQKALDKSPGLYDAHFEMGIALDLKGEYAAARDQFTQAIELAPADSKPQALRAMAVSYAF